MVTEKGSSAATLRPCEEQVLRGHIESAAAGRTNLTDEQVADLLLSAFPQTYPRRDRKLLTERVAKITRLPYRRGDAIDEPTPVTNKRRKIDETENVSSQVEVSSSSVSTSSSASSGWELDRSEMNENGDGGRRDGNGNNQPTFRDLAATGELGGGRREMNKNGDGGWRDGSGNNRPMFRDLYGSYRFQIDLDELRREC